MKFIGNIMSSGFFGVVIFIYAIPPICRGLLWLMKAWVEFYG